MKYSQRLIAGLILFSLCVAAMASSGIVGKWKGKIVVDFSKLPKPTDPAKAQQIENAKKQLAGLVLNFEFKADKTFSVIGGPMKKPQQGTWSLAGNVVTLKASPQNAKQQPSSQDFQLSKDGKTMSKSQGTSKIVLTKS